jgi:sporulation protein YlmC with PRC-barrel domain
MDLVRDCLDKQLVDRNGHNIGRVDAVVLQLEKGKQPTVAFIEVGPVSQAERLHRGLSRVAKAISRRLGVNQQDPFRIPWSKLVAAGIEVIADVDAEKTPALAWELWLRKKIIGRIPGA